MNTQESIIIVYEGEVTRWQCEFDIISCVCPKKSYILLECTYHHDFKQLILYKSHVAPLNRVYAILGWFWEISFLFNWYWYKVTIKIINFDAYVCIKKERITAATALYCNTIIKCSSITYHLTFHSTATMTMTTSMVTRCNNSTLILWLYCF